MDVCWPLLHIFPSWTYVFPFAPCPSSCWQLHCFCLMSHHWYHGAIIQEHMWMNPQSSPLHHGSNRTKKKWHPRLSPCTEWENTNILTGFSSKCFQDDPLSMHSLHGSPPTWHFQMQWVFLLGQEIPNDLKLKQNQDLLHRKGDITLCIDWQFTQGCTSTQHDSKHICSVAALPVMEPTNC